MNLDTFAPKSDSPDSLTYQAAAEQPQTLRDSVEIAMRNYFSHLEEIGRASCRERV